MKERSRAGVLWLAPDEGVEFTQGRPPGEDPDPPAGRQRWPGVGRFDIRRFVQALEDLADPSAAGVSLYCVKASRSASRALPTNVSSALVISDADFPAELTPSADCSPAAAASPSPTSVGW